MGEHLTLPIELFSSKNSKRILFNKKTGRQFVAKSAVAMSAEKTMLQVLTLYSMRWKKLSEGKKYPLRLHIYLYRRNRIHFDWVNIVQLLFDVMQKTAWLPDDDMEHLIPVFEGWEVDKDNPRVELWLD